MWVSFGKPIYLLLIPAAAALLWHSGRASYADLSGLRRWVAWGMRAAIVLALILALAKAQLVRQSRDMVVVFAVDGSFSVPAEERARALEFVQQALKHRRPADRAALVVFGREAAVESENLRSAEDTKLVSRPSPTHTNLAAAMRLSLGLLPPESAGKLVLLTDGNENVGSAAQEVLLAQANRVPVDVVPLRTRRASDVLVRSVGMPSEAREGEPFPLRVTLESGRPTEVVLTVLADDKPAERRRLTLAAGSSALRIPVSLTEAGFHRLDVVVEAAEDECRENNVGSAFVRIRGKPRVLLVDSDAADAAALARGLQTQEMTVEVGGPALLPTNNADLERYDSVLLSNYPAYRMTGHQMIMLRNATRDRGIGLGMVGGEFSFGAGGYYRTPIEEALPVDMDLKQHRAMPASAVLIVMDTSGSMGMMEEGKEKIQLAAEAACAVVDLLQPYDSVGVIASDPRPTLVAPLRKVEQKSAIQRDVRSLRAGGGGIACFPSLRAAYGALRADPSSVRHVIMLADGSDCDQQEGCLPLADRMAREKMTITTVAFGDGPHVPFLKHVAALGKGHFYLTERASDLKQIFTRETLTIAKSVLVEETFRPRLAESSAVVQGVDWASAPPLLGYVATSPKHLAKVPLLSHKNDPLFAHWQYGLGKSIAFTSDAKAHWAAHWLDWQGYPQFWSQAVRWSLRYLSSGILYPRVEPEGDRARIVVEATGEDGSPLNGLELRANVALPSGERSGLTLGQTAPGRYEATVETPDSGAYVVGLDASGPGGLTARQTVGFAVAYPPDFADTEPREEYLRDIAAETGGNVIAKPEDAFVRPDVMPRYRTDIWRALLWMAALLLPLDVAVRRLIIRREDIAAFTGPVASTLARLRQRRRAAASPPRTVGRLLERKASVRERATDDSAPRIKEPPAIPEAPPRQPASPPAPRKAAPASERTTDRLLDLKRKRKKQRD